METAIKIGSEVSKQTSESLASLIKNVFESGYENHMEQKTIRSALEMVCKVSAIDRLTISHCNINGDKIVNMDEEQ